MRQVETAHSHARMHHEWQARVDAHEAKQRQQPSSKQSNDRRRTRESVSMSVSCGLLNGWMAVFTSSSDSCAVHSKACERDGCLHMRQLETECPIENNGPSSQMELALKRSMTRACSACMNASWRRKTHRQQSVSRVAPRLVAIQQHCKTSRHPNDRELSQLRRGTWRFATIPKHQLRPRTQQPNHTAKYTHHKHPATSSMYLPSQRTPLAAAAPPFRTSRLVQSLHMTREA